MLHHYGASCHLVAVADVPNLETDEVAAPQLDGDIRMARLSTDMAAVKQMLKTDSEAEPATLRCRIYARVFVWNPLFAGHGDASEYELWCRKFGCAIPAIEFRPRLEG
ncbi:hypothetical protein [Variovorax sp. LjRoot175]|uniref:hypothetical protein n=1 Tax=Variovorax sp. LjRoot175 TaxID=3342276 RepID=UPI003F519476